MLNIHELFVPTEIINRVYADDSVRLGEKIPANSYLILRANEDPKCSALVRHDGEGVYHRVNSKQHKAQLGILPKDSKQTAFMDCLLNPKILITAAIGAAGTGKTTLAVAYALAEYQREAKPVILSKPAVMVGRGEAFGPVPGDISEKYAPYIESFKMVMRKLLSSDADTYVEEMYKKKAIQFIPVEQTRGCTYDNCTFIIDEAQNLTWHEINTLATRMGEGTKLIILGDLNQIDIRSSRAHTGLATMVESQTYQASAITSAIQLTTVYRSPITKLVIDIDKELRSESTRDKGSSNQLTVSG